MHETYGPTVGDKIRLADTELWLEVERDYMTYGDRTQIIEGVLPEEKVFIDLSKDKKKPE